jgi:hypothetical protein
MFFSFLSIPILLDIICIVHIVKTNRERYWIYIVIFAPLIGSVAYFITELIPSILSGRKAHELSSAFSNSLTRNKKIEELEALLAVSDTYQNKYALAEAYSAANINDKAITVFRSCLAGIYENDPHLLQKIAHLYFRAADWDNARIFFEKTMEHHELDKKYRLTYALSLVRTGIFPKAEPIFKVLEKEGDLEGIYHYAQYLRENGNETAAMEKYKSILVVSKTIPRFVYRENKKWINLAKEAAKDQPAI